MIYTARYLVNRIISQIESLPDLPYFPRSNDCEHVKSEYYKCDYCYKRRIKLFIKKNINRWCSTIDPSLDILINDLEELCFIMEYRKENALDEEEKKDGDFYFSQRESFEEKLKLIWDLVGYPFGEYLKYRTLDDYETDTFLKYETIERKIDIVFEF